MAKQTSLENYSGADGVPSFDFRGVVCPLNFVRTKIELEKVEVGERIRIRLDDGEPMQNVPRSLLLEGQLILNRFPNGDGSYTLEIERRR